MPRTRRDHATAQKTNGLRLVAGFLTICSLFSIALYTNGAEVAEIPIADTGSPADRLNPDDVEAFVDGVVLALMAQERIAGSAVAVVSAERPLLFKGYGWANADTGERVDPQKHLFIVASITKLFTASAILQLAERGQVDLQANIRTYLPDIALDTSQGPVTVAHLLSHTAGFDEPFSFTGPYAAMVAAPVSEQIERAAPKAHVYPPGSVTAYCNFCYVLLGEIIARVSGVPYDEYISSKFLGPLEMTSSTMKINHLGPERDSEETRALRGRLAESHQLSDGGFRSQSFPPGMPTTSAAGGLRATAVDMARFMRLYLNRGVLDGKTVLAPQTAGLFLQPLHQHAPGSGTNNYGFWSWTSGEHTLVGHGGSGLNQKSKLVMIPELGLGIFIATNSASGSALRILPEYFLQHFFPSADYDPPSPPSDFKDRAARYEGDYLQTRRSRSGFLKFFSTLSTMSARTTDDGFLVFGSGEKARRYVETAPDQFASLDNGRVLSFAGEPGEKARWLFPDDNGLDVYERVEKTSIAGVALPFLLTVIGSMALLVVSCVEWRKGTALPAGRLHTAAYFISILSGASWLIALLFLGLGFASIASDPTGALFDGWPAAVTKPYFSFIWVTITLSILMIVTVLPAVLLEGWTTRKRALYLLVAGSFAYAMIAGFQWNLFTP
ncbi:MAG: serine hydrolase domain-containing protein [Pseudomonadota bacterium]